MKKYRLFIILGVLSTVLMLGGAVLFFGEEEESVSSNNESTTTSAPISMPALDRPIVIPDSFSQDGAEAKRAVLASIIEALENDPDDILYWLELGIHRKQINDYEGAREVWEYAMFIRPHDDRAYNNLADLYAYYLHDSKKAEFYFEEALKRDPSAIQYYVSAFFFYIDVMGDKEKARQILIRGIDENPGTSQTLQDMLQNVDAS